MLVIVAIRLEYKLRSLYCSSNIVRIKHRRLRTGRVAKMEEGRSYFKVLIDKHTEKGPLGRPRRRWGHSIKNGS